MDIRPTRLSHFNQDLRDANDTLRDLSSTPGTPPALTMTPPHIPGHGLPSHAGDNRKIEDES